MTDDQWNALMENLKDPIRWEKITKMKKPLYWICSRSATTVTRRKATLIVYNLQLLKWKRSLNLQKMEQTTSKVAADVCSVHQEAHVSSTCGDPSCVRELVQATLKQNLQWRKKGNDELW